VSIKNVPATNMFGKSSHGLDEDETQDEDVEMIDLTAESVLSGGMNKKRRKVDSEAPVTRNYMMRLRKVYRGSLTLRYSEIPL